MPSGWSGHKPSLWFKIVSLPTACWFRAMCLERGVRSARSIATPNTACRSNTARCCASGGKIARYVRNRNVHNINVKFDRDKSMVKGRALWHHFMLRMSVSETRPGGDPGGSFRSASREWGSAPNSEPSGSVLLSGQGPRVGSNAVSIAMQGACRHTLPKYSQVNVPEGWVPKGACRRQ